MTKADNNLGCGEEINMETNSGFICGIANAFGEEKFCKKCMQKLRNKWDKEDKEKLKNFKFPNKLTGGKK